MAGECYGRLACRSHWSLGSRGACQIPGRRLSGSHRRLRRLVRFFDRKLGNGDAVQRVGDEPRSEAARATLAEALGKAAFGPPAQKRQHALDIEGVFEPAQHAELFPAAVAGTAEANGLDIGASDTTDNEEVLVSDFVASSPTEPREQPAEIWISPLWWGSRTTFDFARRFYKSGFKSDNKDKLDPEDRLPSARYQAIDQSRAAMMKITNDIVFAETNTSCVERGRLIVCTTGEAGSAGNCVAMTCVAAWLASTLPKMQCYYLGYCSLTPPGDHALLIICEAELGEFFEEELKTLGSLEEMQRLTSDSAVFVDVWAGICCAAKDYPSECRRKMGQWTAKGKRVLCYLDTNGKDRAWGEPSGAFQRFLLETAANVVDARTENPT